MKTTTMSRGELIQAAQGFIQNTGSLTGSVASVIRQALDVGYQEALDSYDWPQLVTWRETAVSIIAGQGFLHLPPDVDRLLALQDEQSPLNLAEFAIGPFVHRTGGSVRAQGTLADYTQIGIAGTSVPLDANTALEVVGGTGEVREGWVKGELNGLQKQVNFTATEASAVSVGSWDLVYEFSVESVGSADLTLRTVSGSVTKATIPARARNVEYKRYRLSPVTANTTTLRAVYYRKPLPIYDDGQAYEIPIQSYLYHLGIATAYQYKRNRTLAQDHMQMALESLLSRERKSEVGAIQQAAPIRPFRRTTNIVTQNP